MMTLDGSSKKNLTTSFWPIQLILFVLLMQGCQQLQKQDVSNQRYAPSMAVSSDSDNSKEEESVSEPELAEKDGFEQPLGESLDPNEQTDGYLDEESQDPPSEEMLQPVPDLTESQFNGDAFTTKTIPLIWNAAVDADSPIDQLEYAVFQHSEEIADKDLVANTATLIMDWTKNSYSHLVSELNPGTIAYFWLMVRDPDLNQAISDPLMIQTDTFCGGEGTPASPFQICSLQNLNSMRDHLSRSFVLKKSIDSRATSSWNRGNGFYPIGQSDTPFTGSLDGAGHSLLGITIDYPDQDQVGIFGVLQDGRVENLILKHLLVNGREQVGGLVGVNNGQIRRVIVSGSVSGQNKVGGLAGNSTQLLEGIISTADVQGTGEGIGGIVGNTTAELRIATASGSVTGNQMVGGLAGSSNQGFRSLISMAKIFSRGDAPAMVGGIAGKLEGDQVSANQLIFDGLINAPDTDRVGGVLGRLSGNPTTENSLYWEGKNSANLYFAFSGGDVLGKSKVGGLVGEALGQSSAFIYNTEGRIESVDSDQAAKVFGAAESTTQFEAGYSRVESSLPCTLNSEHPHLADCIQVDRPTPDDQQTVRLDPMFQFFKSEANPIKQRKISLAMQKDYQIFGTCKVLGEKIAIKGAVQAETTCQGYLWKVSLDFSELPDGTQTIQIESSSGPGTSMSLEKAADYCKTKSDSLPFAGGNGSGGSPFLICSLEQFRNVSENSGPEAHFTLMNDLDFSWDLSEPPKIQSDSSCLESLCGSFDGNGFRMLHYSALTTDSEPLGFFPVIPEGTVKNLGVEHLNLIGSGHLGGLVGVSPGEVEISHVWTSGNLMQFFNLEDSLSVSSNFGSGFNQGGVVGYARTLSLERIFSETVVMNPNSHGTGGIVGKADFLTLSKVWRRGPMITFNASGGVVGTSFSAEISEAIVEGTHLSFEGAGGITSGDGTITDSWSDQTLGAIWASGGLAGKQSLGISRSFGSGVIALNGGSSGGLLAWNSNTTSTEIKDSFFGGYIYDSTSNGTLMGATGSYTATLTSFNNVSFLVRSDAKQDCVATTVVGPSNSDCESTSNMSDFFSKETPVFSNWDFDSVWKSVPDDFPKLRWLEEK